VHAQCCGGTGYSTDVARSEVRDLCDGGGGCCYYRGSLVPLAESGQAKGYHRVGFSGHVRQKFPLVYGCTGTARALGSPWEAHPAAVRALAGYFAGGFPPASRKYGHAAGLTPGNGADHRECERLLERSALLEAHLPRGCAGNPRECRLLAIWSPLGPSRLCPAGYFQLGRRPPLGPFSRL